jgi:hypothetical protein
MRIQAGWLGVALLMGSASTVLAQDPERYVLGRVRLTTDPARTRGCALLGTVSDDSVKDLRRKIVRLGGDSALLTFGVEDLSMIYAQVFRCPPAPPAATPPAGTPAPPPPPPPGTPPPPPGPPPPPPAAPR